MKTITFILFISFFYLLSCTEEETIKPLPKTKWNTEESINMQSTFLEEENDEIDSYLKHHKDWKMTKRDRD